MEAIASVTGLAEGLTGDAAIMRHSPARDTLDRTIGKRRP